jgi:hypothetical protein
LFFTIAGGATEVSRAISGFQIRAAGPPVRIFEYLVGTPSEARTADLLSACLSAHTRHRQEQPLRNIVAQALGNLRQGHDHLNAARICNEIRTKLLDGFPFVDLIRSFHLTALLA